MPFWKTGAAEGVSVPPDPLRWHPLPVPDEAADFIDGLRTVVVNGDADAQTGIAVHLVLANRQHAARLRQCRRRDAAGAAAGRAAPSPPNWACCTWRRARSRCCRAAWSGSVALDGPSRLYVCENYGAPFRLPELGPIGSQRPGQCARLPGARGGLRSRSAAHRDREEVRRPPLAHPRTGLALQRGGLARQPGAVSNTTRRAS